MADEKISVVVPAYNLAPWLPRCLDSILSQSHPDLEVIVVNDGSADDTKAVLDAYAQGKPNVKVIHQENQGVTAARLRGLREAGGDWIGFIDGDDEIDREMYAHLLGNAHRFQGDIAHCGHQVLFPDGRVEQVHGTGTVKEQTRLEGLRDLLDGSVVESSLCTKLYRRELFEGLEDWMDTSIKNNEDLLMNYYLFNRAKKAIYEDVCPYRYILRHGSASYQQLHERSLFDPVRVRQKILADCCPEIREDARNALMRNILFACGQLALNGEKQYDSFRQQARALLMEQKDHFHLLSKRNYILANMICLAPWSFTLAYRLYVKLFQRQEQH